MHVKQLDNVWMAEFSEDLNLVLQHLQARSGEPLHFYDLHCTLLLVLSHALIHATAITSANLIGKSIAVVTNQDLVLIVATGGLHHLIGGSSLSETFVALLLTIRTRSA